jgi:hypothetical protein
MQYYVYGGAAPDVFGADVLIKGGMIIDNNPNTIVFLAEAYNSVLRISAASISHHADAAVRRELGGWGQRLSIRVGIRHSTADHNICPIGDCRSNHQFRARVEGRKACDLVGGWRF